MTDLFGMAGQKLLAEVQLAEAYRIRVDSLRDLIGYLDQEVTVLDGHVRDALCDHKGLHALQTIPGVGPVLATVFVAEIGDVERFVGHSQLASWAGLTPKHRESDTTLHRGPITKQGSRLVRWAAVEAAQRQRNDTQLRRDFLRISASHGNTPGARKVARVAVARKIITLAHYGLRDGDIRQLAQKAA
jgi:transposase